jgi:hypothetical protein
VSGLDASAVLRPYEGLEGLEGALRGLEVRVRNQGNWNITGDVQLRLEDFHPLGLEVRWLWAESEFKVEVREALDEASLHAEDVSLVALLRCGATKTIKCFLDVRLDQLFLDNGLQETKIPVSDRPKIVPNREVRLEFYLLLNTTIQDNFPYPYRKGTWLTQKFITVSSSEHASFDFHWADLTDEVRIEKELHKNSVLFVENRIPMQEADRFSDCVDAYVDPDHQAAIKSHGSSALGKYLQAQLVRSVVAESLIFALSQMRGKKPLAWAELEAQPVLGRLCRVMAASGQWAGERLDAEEVFTQLIQSPTLVNEYLDDLFSVRKLAKSLARKE